MSDIGRIRVELMVGMVMADDSIKSQTHTKEDGKKKKKKMRGEGRYRSRCTR